MIPKKKIKQITFFLFIVIIISIICLFTYKSKTSVFYNIENIDAKAEKINDEKITNYYVSSDGTSKDGTDINSPMSLEEANKKIFKGNERVLFKSNDIFYGIINFNIDVKDDEVFIISSYGDGKKPIISGANYLVNNDAWYKDGELYVLDLSKNENFEGIGKTNYEPYNIGFIKDEKGEIYGSRKKKKESLVNEYDFMCDNNLFYIKCNENPSVKLGKIAFVSKKDLVYLSSNTIIENLDIKETGAHGIVKKGTNIKNVQIKNCIIEDIGGSVQTEDPFTRYGNGIEFWNQAENTIVEDCIIRNIYDSGYTVQGNETKGKFIKNICRNNIFINCTYDIEMYSFNRKNINEQTILKQQIIENNISINQGRGWGYNVRNNKDAASVLVLWRDYNLPKDADIELTNNKFINSRNIYYTYYIDPIEKEHYKNCVKSNNNTFYLNDDSTLFSMKGNITNKDILKEYDLDDDSTFKKLYSNSVEDLYEISKISEKENIKNQLNNFYNENEYYQNKDLIELDYKNIIVKYKEIIEKNGLEKIFEEIKPSIDNVDISDIIESQTDKYIELINKYNSENLEITQEEYKELIYDLLMLMKKYEYFYNKENKVSEISENTLKERINKIIYRYTENNDDQYLVSSTDSINMIKDLYINSLNNNIIENNFTKFYIEKACDLLEVMVEESIKKLANEESKEINIKYNQDLNTLTNKSITALIALKNDKSQITNNDGSTIYTFDKNGKFKFEVKIRGYSYEYTAEVNNIDKIAPIIRNVEENSSYSEVTPLVIDENLEKVELYKNGNIVKNYKINSKITEFGTYKIIAKDLAKNVTTINFKINNSEKYIVKDNNIMNIYPKTPGKYLIGDLKLEKEEIYRSGKAIKNDEIVCTGDILKQSDGSNYTLIVNGDIDKDGQVTIRDLIKLRNILLNIEKTDDCQKLAADTDMDNKEINIKDLVAIRNLILQN